MQERNYEAMDGDQKVTAILIAAIAAVVISIVVSISVYNIRTTKMYMDAGLVECYTPQGSNIWTKPDACPSGFVYGKMGN